MKVILLAAGRGRRFGNKTKITPKCLIPLTHKKDHLLARYLDSFRILGLKNILIVCGHQKEKIIKACRMASKNLRIQFIYNKHYRQGSILSLYRASRHLNQDCLVMDADVYFPTALLKKLLVSKHPTAFLVDPRSKSSGEEMMLMSGKNAPVMISKKVDPLLRILGEATGFLKIQKKDAQILQKSLRDLIRKKKFSVEYEEAYCSLMQKTAVGVETVGNYFWAEMDFEKDRRKILKHLKGIKP